jgi:hypothetical protein
MTHSRTSSKIDKDIYPVGFGSLLRELLGNAYHEGFRVNAILQTNTRHRIPNQ